MSILKLAMFSCLAFAGSALQARADVLIEIDQSTQSMSVDVDGRHLYDWRVSSGMPGYDTPNGVFRPNRMDADHYSVEYDNAPMPHSIFFDLHGHAIHGSYEAIGHPAASHGCVRLSPSNAAELFDLVKKEGMANTKVEISGDVKLALHNAKPGRTRVAAARRSRSVRDDVGSDMSDYPSYPSGNDGYDRRYYYQSQQFPYDSRQPGWSSW